MKPKHVVLAGAILLYYGAACFAMGLVFTGCATTTPDDVVDRVVAVDTSTPPGMPVENNGWLGYRTVDGKEWGTITDNKRDYYLNLAKAYRVLFRKTYQVDLDLFNEQNLKPYQINGVRVWLVDLQYVKYFARLKRWDLNEQDPDGIIDKILN